MVHVEYDATATVTEVDEYENVRDGHDKKEKRLQMTSERRVLLKYEFPTGYVNLEGYAPRYTPEYVHERIEHDTPDNAKVQYDTLEATIYGNSDEWITQARRYIAERPDMDVLDALNLFLGWDCTESYGVERAIAEVETGRVDDLTPFTPDYPEV